jgi:sulfoxide reductase heme-binding subunit YedZ
MNLKRLDGKTLSVVKALLFLVALIPLGKLIAMGLTVGLGANPIEKITRTTGYWTLTFLMITLSVTPARKLSGWQWLVRMRRMLGLYTFFYASLHFLTYLVVDQFFDWSAILKDIVKRPYITVGFPSFVLLMPLAITSTDGMVRRLGGKNWRRLHRLVYLTAAGGVVHFWWLVKKDISNPLNFACILALLLGFRLYEPVRRYAGNRLAARDSRAS